MKFKPPSEAGRPRRLKRYSGCSSRPQPSVNAVDSRNNSLLQRLRLQQGYPRAIQNDKQCIVAERGRAQNTAAFVNGKLDLIIRIRKTCCTHAWPCGLSSPASCTDSLRYPCLVATEVDDTVIAKRRMNVKKVLHCEIPPIHHNTGATAVGNVRVARPEPSQLLPHRKFKMCSCLQEASQPA